MIKRSRNPAKEEALEEKSLRLFNVNFFLFFKQASSMDDVPTSFPCPLSAFSHLSPLAPGLVSSLPELCLSGV